MTNPQRIAQIKTLDRTGLTKLSEDRSCQHPMDAHERKMFASGFRKGLKSALRGDRQLIRADVRESRGRHGDSAWTLGFVDGMNYVPCNHTVKTPPQAVKSCDPKTLLSPSEYRRLRRRNKA